MGAGGQAPAFNSMAEAACCPRPPAFLPPPSALLLTLPLPLPLPLALGLALAPPAFCFKASLKPPALLRMPPVLPSLPSLWMPAMTSAAPLLAIPWLLPIPHEVSSCWDWCLNVGAAMQGLLAVELGCAGECREVAGWAAKDDTLRHDLRWGAVRWWMLSAWQQGRQQMRG